MAREGGGSARASTHKGMSAVWGLRVREGMRGMQATVAFLAEWGKPVTTDSTEHRGLLTPTKIKSIQKSCEHRWGDEHVVPRKRRRLPEKQLRWCQTCGLLHRGTAEPPRRGFDGETIDLFEVEA